MTETPKAPTRLTDYYYWIVLFENGTCIDQLSNNDLPAIKRLDVNRLPAELGQATFIILAPRVLGRLRPVAVSIPPEHAPCYAGRTTMSGTTVTKFVYLVGYHRGRHRSYYEVDPATGDVRWVEDYDG
jgi:hypothetical protein